VHPDEFIQLFNTILINVLLSSAITQSGTTLQRKFPGSRQQVQASIRIWSAGCASGQEAYLGSLAEALGVEQFAARVKIYATDWDEEALNQARHAAYNAREVGGFPAELLERYFECSATIPFARTCAAR